MCGVSLTRVNVQIAQSIVEFVAVLMMHKFGRK